MSTLDTLGRPIGSLRLSVTDRCNLRCHYCMPEDEYRWLPREDLLSLDEISTVADLFGDLGVDRIRLTGGEPLLRRNLPILIDKLAQKSWVRDLAMTTNGVLLADAAQELKHVGLRRLTVSLDTLKSDRFKKLARIDALSEVLEGIDTARRVGFLGIKLDSVITRGDNDDELVDLVEYARSVGAEIRFIEYMDVGGATSWRPDKVVTRAEILARFTEQYGTVTAIEEPGSTAPAARFRLPDGTTFGIISSTSQPFCRTCDRSRLTADGILLLCLYAQQGIDLRRPLRAGASHDAMLALIRDAWTGRTDRGAEDRLRVGDRGTYIPVTTLKKEPHLEMHTRGG